MFHTKVHWKKKTNADKKSKCKLRQTDHQLFPCVLAHRGSIPVDVTPQHGRCLHWSLTNAWVTVVTNTDNPAHSLMLHLSALASHKKISRKTIHSFRGDNCNWCPLWYHKGPIANIQPSSRDGTMSSSSSSRLWLFVISLLSSWLVCLWNYGLIS